MLPNNIKNKDNVINIWEDHTLVRRHAIAEAAALLALVPELVAVGLGEFWAVVEHVIASVGGGGGQAGAQPAALGAVVFDIILEHRFRRDNKTARQLTL